MRWWLIPFVGLVLVLAVSTVWAQTNNYEPSPYIYRLKIAGCGDHEPAIRRQTGFRVAGTQGIITALHGVADCTEIHAVSDGDGPIFRNLAIQAVDIDRDVALLTSAELLALPADGLAAADPNTLQTRGLHVIGYPLGLDEQDVLLDVSINYTRTLRSLIPALELPPAFAQRNSPNLAQQVFRVQAHLLPGHSGAPLLDDLDRVIAIANGGLRGGKIAWGWAFPWSGIHLNAILPEAKVDEDLLSRLQELKEQSPHLALSFSSTYPSLADDENESSIQTGVVQHTDGEPIRNAEVTVRLTDNYRVDYTDTFGQYKFSFPSEAQGKLETIQVEYEGYETKTQRLFDELPSVIRLEPLVLSQPVMFEVDDYVRVVRRQGLQLQEAARDNSSLLNLLGTGRLLRIVGGPVPREGREWWRVCIVDSNSQCGWTVVSSVDDIYVERLPLIFVNDQLEVISNERVRMRDKPNGRTIGFLSKGQIVTVVNGPEEADRYVWYQLKKEDGVTGWAILTGNLGLRFEVAPQQTPTKTPTGTPTPTLTRTVTPTLISSSTPTPTETPVSTPTSTMTSITMTSTPVVPPTPSHTATPTVPLLQCQQGIDPAMRRYVVQDLGCPISSEVILASYTRYERGFMMWRSDDQLIYGFFDGKNWGKFEDEFNSDLPEMPQNNRGAPPPGLYHPIRGTGLLWANNDYVFENLGWAIMEQRRFCAEVMKFDQGFIVRDTGLGSCAYRGGSLNSERNHPAFDFEFVRATFDGKWVRN